MKSDPKTLQQIILQETDGGLDLVRFFANLMKSEVESVKTSERAAAARELMDRCFGKPFTATDRSAEVFDDAGDASDVLIDRIMRVIEEMSPDEQEDDND